MKKQLNRWKMATMRRLTHLNDDESGAALVEYGLLVGLIAVVCVAAVGVLGTTINGVFGAINAALAAALPGG